MSCSCIGRNTESRAFLLAGSNSAFNKTDRSGYIAPIRVRSRPDFNEATQSLIGIRRDKYRPRQRTVHPALNQTFDFASMLRKAPVGPQLNTLPRNFVFIALPRNANRNRRHSNDFTWPPGAQTISPD